MSEVESIAVENPVLTQEQPVGTAEEVKTEGSVGFKVEKGDGTIVEGQATPAEGSPKAELPPKVDVDMKLSIPQPIRDFLEVRSKKMGLPLPEIYSSLVEDAFKTHYQKLCPYCGEEKLKWLRERQNEYNLAKKLKILKEKRIKKAQKEARRQNRGTYNGR